MIDNEIKVSVCIVAYNQEEYIQDCLESLINQNVSFKYEIIVSDDNSSDRTREIIDKYSNKYPEKIKPIYHDVNIGPYENYIYTHGKARGEYIAHVDADDYYFPDKLQIQADFLDKNKDCNIVWHHMKIENSNGVLFEPRKTIKHNKYRRENIIRFIAIGKNSSKMYRRKMRDFSLPNFELVDYLANVEQVGDGYASYAADQCLGVYRCGVGISSVSDNTRKVLAKSFIYIYEKYPQYRIELNTAVLTYFLRDLKNLRRSSLLFAKIWLKTFHFLSIYNVINTFVIKRNNHV